MGLLWWLRNVALPSGTGVYFPVWKCVMFISHRRVGHGTQVRWEWAGVGVMKVLL